MDGELDLTTDGLEAFRQVFAAMHRQFPEIRRLRPEQFLGDDPLKGVLERIITEYDDLPRDAGRNDDSPRSK